MERRWLRNDQRSDQLGELMKLPKWSSAKQLGIQHAVHYYCFILMDSLIILYLYVGLHDRLYIVC